MVIRWLVLVASLVVGAGLLVVRAFQPNTEGPLSRAARTGDLASLQTQLASGTDPNSPDGPRGFRALAIASRNAQLSTMSVLIGAGANPNLRDAGGNRWVPLQHAVHKHRTTAVAFLLTHGAAVDGPGDRGLTPLMMAAASGQTDVVQLLLDHGADPRRRADGASVLDLAVSGGALTDIDEPLLGACHTETVQLLVSRFPDLRVSDTWRGHVSALFARLNGCRDVLNLVRLPR